MSAPRCPVHKCEMKPSRYTSGWYCPNKVDGKWCSGTTARYRCQGCGVTASRAYCSVCDDDALMVLETTGKPEPAPFGQSGLDEDHYGHG